MYSELVKALLAKHFGPPRGSLVVGDADASGDKLYFYTLPASKERELVALRDLLGMRDLVDGIDRLPELRQTIPEKNEAWDEIPQCVCFCETDGRWTARFHVVTGVVYHRTYGNKVAATLQTDGYPSVTLSDEADDFYGFWRRLRRKKRRTPDNDREGLSYWMNKALRTNDRFRGFAADFFDAVGRQEKRGILRDAAKAIAACGCFLPPVSFVRLLECRTPRDLIGSFQNEAAGLRVNFNKLDMNVGYVMVMLAPEIDERDRRLLLELDEKEVSDAVSLKLLYDGFSAAEFIRWYYRKKLAGDEVDEYGLKMCVEDYVAMCADAGEKLRLGLDLNALMRAHDALVEQGVKAENREEFAYPLVAVPSKFDALETAIRKTGSAEFERIRTTERLFLEGERQRNCVFSRRTAVRMDAASIYHWSHEDASYTIQFRLDKRKKYAVEEIRARFNQTITQKHLKDLKRLLDGFCTVDDAVAAPLFLQGPDEEARRRRIAGAFPGWDPDQDLPF